MQGGPTPRDEELVRWLRRHMQGTLLLVANKCERKARPGTAYAGRAAVYVFADVLVA